MKKDKKIGIILLAAGICIVAWALIGRHFSDISNNTVDVISPGSVSVGGIMVVEEYTLGQWRDMSRVGLLSPGQPFPEGFDNDSHTVLVFSSREYFGHALTVLGLKVPGKVRTAVRNGLYFIVVEDLLWDDLQHMGMGIPASEPGAGICIRPVNDIWINAAYIEWFFNNTYFDSVIFKGNEVTGFPLHLQSVKHILREKQAVLYKVEFNEQKGFSTLALGLSIVRLHSINMKVSPERIMARVVRALRERGVRAVYITEYDDDTVRRVERIVTDSGYRLGNPDPIDSSIPISFSSFIGALSVLAGLILCFGYGWFLIILFLLIPGFFYMPQFSLNVLVLLAAICFPVLSAKEVMASRRGFGVSVSIIFTCSIIAGFAIYSAASSGQYVSGLTGLRGIKIALLFPLLLSYFWVIGDIKGRLEHCVRWRDAMILILVFAAGITYLMRSSNNNPALVTGMEIKLRNFLEQVFVYRPRFKEFMFGHPLLIFSLYLIKKKNIATDTVKLLFIAGMTGQVSVINTFMHIHSPLAANIVRTVWGWAAGGGLAGVFIAVYILCQKLKK